MVKTPAMSERIKVEALNAVANRNLTTPLIGGDNPDQTPSSQIPSSSQIITPNIYKSQNPSESLLMPPPSKRQKLETDDAPIPSKHFPPKFSIDRPQIVFKTPLRDAYKINQREGASAWEKSSVGGGGPAEMETAEERVDAILNTLPKP